MTKPDDTMQEALAVIRELLEWIPKNASSRKLRHRAGALLHRAEKELEHDAV